MVENFWKIQNKLFTWLSLIGSSVKSRITIEYPDETFLELVRFPIEWTDLKLKVQIRPGSLNESENGAELIARKSNGTKKITQTTKFYIFFAPSRLFPRRVHEKTS